MVSGRLRNQVRVRKKKRNADTHVARYKQSFPGLVQDLIVAAILSESIYKAVDHGHSLAEEAIRFLESRTYGSSQMLENIVWGTEDEGQR